MITPQQITQAVNRIADAANPSKIILFGSYARGEERASSDTDIAVFAGEKKSIREISEMQIEFAKIFHIKNLELVDLSGRVPLFLKQVADDGKVLYEQKPGIFDAFQIYAFKRHSPPIPL